MKEYLEEFFPYRHPDEEPLTERQRNNIRLLYEQGVTDKELARRFYVSDRTIMRIVKNKKDKKRKET